MRKIFIILISIVLCTDVLKDLKTETLSDMKYQNQNTIAHFPPLRIVVFQDVSGSIRQNGVEIISSSVFAPYFAETRRTIELNFGCITDSSAHTLITVSLPACTFCAPSAPDLDHLTITEQLDLKSQYYDAEKKYVADSMTYFIDRRRHIMSFQRQVDALLRGYREHPAPRTDIRTAVVIADRQFVSSMLDSAQNFLVLNSDGKDTYHANLGALKNPALTILVNASSQAGSALDALHPVNLQSMEQAIQFTLHNNQKKFSK